MRNVFLGKPKQTFHSLHCKPQLAYSSLYMTAVHTLTHYHSNKY